MLPRMMIALVLSAVTALPAMRAAAENQTITVSAMGEAEARPDTLVLNGVISESSPKMKDAVTAFNDTRRRALAAIQGVEIENLDIQASALSVSMASGMAEFDDFGPGDDDAEPLPEGALTVSQSVTLTVKGLAEMEEKAVIELVVSVIDAAREAGIDLNASDPNDMMMMRMGMGEMPETSAVFKLSDPEGLLKDATRDAMKKARADAEFLAELAGGKLGRVVAISDSPGGADNEQMNPYAMIFGMMMDEEIEFGSTSYEPIKVGRALSVRFELITE